MTASATEFIRPLTFETISGRPVITNMFGRPAERTPEHVSVAHRSGAIVIAPATANVIARIAGGVADDFLSTTVLAAECTVVIAPAMNQSMLANPIYRENVDKLKRLGYVFVDGARGELVSGELGFGRMAEPAQIAEVVAEVVRCSQSLVGERVLVTAGPTREPLDPVRFISNASSGKMGYELARAARQRGAEVTLVSGPTGLASPFEVECVRVTTADEMARAVRERAPACTVLAAAAAVADFTPVVTAERKLKKKDETIRIDLKPTEDILARAASERRPGQVFVGFAAETEYVVENAREKLRNKGLDLVVANVVGGAVGGFAGDENAATLLYADGRPDEDIPLISKRSLAAIVMDRVAALREVQRAPEGKS